MKSSTQTDLGLLVLRVGAGVLMMTHGWAKVMMLVDGKADRFPDVIGLGPLPTLVLAVFAEFVCALLVVLGIRTRWSAIPVAVTMAVAAFIAHAGDPFQRRELALVYLVVFSALAVMGGGRYSFDVRFGGRGR